MLHWAGDTVAMMDVFVRPPRESWRMRVSLLSLVCAYMHMQLCKIMKHYIGHTKHTASYCQTLLTLKQVVYRM